MTRVEQNWFSAAELVHYLYISETDGAGDSLEHWCNHTVVTDSQSGSKFTDSAKQHARKLAWLSTIATSLFTEYRLA